MPRELTLAALAMAPGWRDPPAGLTHQFDRGSQYAAGDYRKVLAARGITVSMNRKGDCRHNAPMASANGAVQVECVHGAQFKTRAAAARAIVEYTTPSAFIRRQAFSLRANSSGAGAPTEHNAGRSRNQAPRVAHRRPAVDNACAGSWRPSKPYRFIGPTPRVGTRS